MALERNNPLTPDARYWVDVAPADQPAFTAWLNANRQAVKVISSSRDADNGWDWVLFEVQAPLVWWEGPGLPTKADAAIRSESDVKQIPKVESPVEVLEGIGRSVSAGAGKAVGLAIAIAVAAAVLNRVLR
jgi:hypothetical protein